MWNNKNKICQANFKLNGPSEGAGILSSVADTGAELFISKGIPRLAKKGVEAGRYYASEFMKDPKLQKKAINYAIKKAAPVVQKVGSEGINQLADKVRPDKYKGGELINYVDKSRKVKKYNYNEFNKKYPNAARLLARDLISKNFLKDLRLMLPV